MMIPELHVAPPPLPPAAKRLWRQPPVQIAAFVVVLFVLILCGMTYDKVYGEHTRVKDIAAGEMTTTLSNWDNRPLRVELVGEEGSFRCSLAESGALHGEAVILVWLEDDLPDSTRQWFWYDEKVSEGEWYTRQGRR